MLGTESVLLSRIGELASWIYTTPSRQHHSSCFASQAIIVARGHFIYPSPRTTLFRQRLVPGHHALSCSATASGPEEVGLVCWLWAACEPPPQAMQSTTDVAFSHSWRRFQKPGVVNSNPNPTSDIE